MGVLALEEVTAPFYLVFPTKLSYYFQYIRSCMCNPIMLVYHNLYLILHIFAHIFHHMQKQGGCANIQSFLTNTSTCIQVSNFSRQVIWSMVMYTPTAEEHKEIRCFCSGVHIFHTVQKQGGCGNSQFSLEILLQVFKVNWFRTTEYRMKYRLC